MEANLHVERVYAKAYVHDAQLQLFHERAFQRAFRRNSAISFHGKRLRVAVSFSVHAAPDQHCYHVQVLASYHIHLDLVERQKVAVSARHAC